MTNLTLVQHVRSIWEAVCKGRRVGGTQGGQGGYMCRWVPRVYRVPREFRPA